MKACKHKPFATVGDRILFIGDSRSRYQGWPQDEWLEKGKQGTVTQYHEEVTSVRINGEDFAELEPWATVRWDFGGETAILAEDRGKRWANSNA